MNEKQMKQQNAWKKRAGYISKSYQMKKELADRFKEACNKVGVSQSGQIIKMMTSFIEQVDEK